MEINKIYQEDCLQTMSRISDNSIDLILTDMPYGINYLSGWTNNHKKIKNDSFNDWLKLLPEWLKEFKRILTETGCCCCCCGGGKTPVSQIFTLELIKYFNLIQTVIWDKKTIGLGWKYRPSYETIVIGSKSKDNYNWYTEKKDVSNIARFNNIIPQQNDHPTIKPINLMRFFINLHSKENDLIYDGFMGGGTTAIACIKEKRNFIGSEIDKNYYEMAIKKINNEKAQLKLF